LRTSFALALAKAASEVGQPQAAISALSQQVRAEGNNARLHQALASSYAATEDYAKAFEAYVRAFQLSPTDQEVGRAAVRSGIALARRTTSNTAKSNAYSESAAIAEKLATAAGTFDNYLLAGEAWMGAGEYQKAVSWFDKARSKQSQNVLVHFYSAQCHTSLGQLDTALAELQQALKIGATGRLRTQVYNQLGFVYDKRKEYDRAKSAYQEAGNSAKVAEMTSKTELAAQNQQAAAEQEEFRRRLAALELQISELEKLGEIDQASELRKQLDELRKVLGD
jgi:tetratricopeptide (TPR) repeat protein